MEKSFEERRECLLERAREHLVITPLLARVDARSVVRVLINDPSEDDLIKCDYLLDQIDEY